VYRLVERFSEDVDILLVCDAGSARRERILKAICERAAHDLGLEEANCVPAGSSTGVKRNVRYNYPRRYESGDITQGVLLEMGIRGGPDPHSAHAVRSMVAERAIKTTDDTSDTWQEFAFMEISVLGAERTLIEKLALLDNQAALFSTDPDALSKSGRHYYDVHQLLRDPTVRNKLQAHDGGTTALASDIYKQSQKAGFSGTPRPAGGYAASAAFARGTPAEAAGRGAYEPVARLVWGELPSFDDCIAIVHEYEALL
jgi:hypothetical protein